MTDTPEDKVAIGDLEIKPSHAEIVFEHYLEMATYMFEALPMEYEFPSTRLSEPGQKAAEAFFKVMQDGYDELDQRYGGTEPDDQVDI